MTPARWSEYPNFTKAEFDCKHSGKNDMKHEFMSKLQALRVEFGMPLHITSGFRDATHPVEANKWHTNGEHTKGTCADVWCDNSSERFRLIQLSLKHGFTRIGIASNFLHLGIGGDNLPQRVIWDYK